MSSCFSSLLGSVAVCEKLLKGQRTQQATTEFQNAEILSLKTHWF